ncbi:hypothetical protein [Pinirhizobacter sp.]|jgi:hypothetical protein|uniref:hypothetical protein n=1 Tax=Pinirhizobacter sp. TaxID=2950432 RepID=UPI002F404659
MDAGTQNELAHLRLLSEEQRNILQAQEGRIERLFTAHFDTRHMVLNATNHAYRNLHLAAIDVIREIQAARDLLETDIQSLREGCAPNSTSSADDHSEFVRKAWANTELPTLTRRSSANAEASPDCLQVLLVSTVFGQIICEPMEGGFPNDIPEPPSVVPGLARALASMLQPGDVYVEFGAGSGFLVLAACQALLDRGSIIAIEPDARRADFLKKTLWLNGFNSIARVNNVVEFVLDAMIDAGARVDLIRIDSANLGPKVLAGASRIMAENPNLRLIVDLSDADDAVWILESDFGVMTIDETSGSLVPGRVRSPTSGGRSDVVLSRVPLNDSDG